MVVVLPPVKDALLNVPIIAPQIAQVNVTIAVQVAV